MRLIVALQGKVPVITSERVKVIVPKQLSVAVATPVTEGVVSLVQVTEILGGQTITGGTLSIV